MRSVIGACFGLGSGFDRTGWVVALTVLVATAGPLGSARAIVHGETGAAGEFGESSAGAPAAEVGVDSSTGAATLELPIDLPPGPNGAQPQLGISYSSGRGDGFLGAGWDVAIPRISCAARFGVPDYGDCEFFEMGGEMLVGPDAEGLYHTFTESFARIERAPNGWTVTTPTGVELSFGFSPESRLEAEGGTATWSLVRSRDVFGNDVLYHYTRGPDGANGIPRIESIDYANDRRKVSFVYEARPDPLVDYMGGVRRVRSERLVEILVHSNDALHHRLRLAYESSNATTRSRLISVQRFGSDCDPASHPIPSSAFCAAMPPAEFSYTDSGSLSSDQRWQPQGRLAGFYDQPPWYAPPAARFGNADIFQRGQSTQFADINGDGLLDIVSDGVAGQNAPLFTQAPDGDLRSSPVVHLNDGQQGWEIPVWAGDYGVDPVNESAIWTRRLQDLRFDLASIRVNTMRSYWMSRSYTSGGDEVFIGPELHGEEQHALVGDIPVLGTCYDGSTPPSVEYLPDAGAVEYAPAKKFTDSPAFDSSAFRSWTSDWNESLNHIYGYFGAPYAWDEPGESEVRPWPHFQFVDLNADGYSDMVMSVHLSGFHVSLDDCTSPTPRAEPEWVEGASTRVVFMNTGDGFVRDDGRNAADGTYADSLPPFGIVAFESADLAYQAIGANENPPYAWRNSGGLTVSPCDDYGLAGQRMQDPIEFDYSYDFCLTSFDLTPVFTDLNGDGYPDLIVTETADPDALFHRFYSTYYFHDTPRPVGYRDSVTRSVAYLQDPHPEPGQPRWVRSESYDPPFEHSLVIQYPTESPGSLANGWANGGDFGNAQVWNVDKGVRFADLNRDGLTDMVFGQNEHPWADFGGQGGVLLNRGAQPGSAVHSAWCSSAAIPGVDECAEEASRYAIPFKFAEFDPRPFNPNAPNSEESGHWAVNWTNSSIAPFQTGISLVDLNGDGWVDVLGHQVQGRRPTAWIQHPGLAESVWVEDERYSPRAEGVYLDASQDFDGYGSGIDFGGSGYAIADVDADGVPDLVASQRRSMIQKESWLSHAAAGQTDLLARYSNGRGLVVELEYGSAVGQRDAALESKALDHALAPLLDADQDNDHLAEPPSPEALHWPEQPVLVSKRVTAVGQDEALTAYRYAHPRRCQEHRTDFGFRLVETTHPDRSRTERYAYQSHGRAGQLAEAIVFDPDGRPLHYEWAEWETPDPASVGGTGVWNGVASSLFGRSFVGRLIAHGARNEYGETVGEAPGFETSSLRFYDDAHGFNFISEERRLTPGRALRVLRQPAAPDVSRNLVGRLRRLQIVSDDASDGRLLSDTKFDYLDPDHRPTFTKPGRVESLVAPRSGDGEAWWVRRDLTYLDSGNLRSETRYRLDEPDGPARRTRYCWDGEPGCAVGHASGSVMVGQEDAHGMWSRLDLHPIFSLPDRSRSDYEDVGSVRLEFDSLGRVTSRLDESLGEGVPRVLETFDYVDFPTGGRPVSTGFVPYRIERRFDGQSDESIFEKVSVDDGASGTSLTIDLMISSSSGTRTAALIAREATRNPGTGRHATSAPFACGALVLTGSASDYVSAIESCLGVPDGLKSWNVVRVDGLGRPLRVDSPIGFEIYAYGHSPYPAVGMQVGPVVPHDVIRHKDANGGLVERVIAAGEIVRVRECGNPSLGAELASLEGVECESPHETLLIREPTGELRERRDPTVPGNPTIGDYGAPLFENQRLVYRRDTLGRIIRIDDPDAGSTEQTYDAFGNLVSSVDARGIEILRSYDALDRPTRIEIEGSDPTGITYHPRRLQVDRVIDGASEKVYAYDARGRIRRIVRYIDGRILRTDYERDGLGRILRVLYPTVLNGAVDTIAYEYDGAYLARVCDLRDSRGDCEDGSSTPLVSSVDYDALGRPARMSLPGGDRVFEYDGASGRRVLDAFESNSPGEDIRFRYALQDPGTGEWRPAYDSLGNLLHVEAEFEASNGVEAYAMAYAYDERNRLGRWTWDGTEFDFEYDARGNMTGHAGAAQTFGPAPTAHAIQSRVFGNHEVSYDYDAAGYRKSMSRSNGTDAHFGFDGQGRLVCIGSGEANCDQLIVRYDGEGERIQEIGSRSYLYSGSDFRMRPGANGADEYWIEIEALGERVGYKHVLGGALRIVSVFPGVDLPPRWRDRVIAASSGIFVLLALASLMTLLSTPAPIRAALSCALMLGVALLPLRVWAGGAVRNPHGAGTAVYRFVLSDSIGTSLVELDASGQRLRRATYSPFGVLVDVEGSSGVGGRNYYAGHDRQGDTGLVYMNARWLDPETGSFLSVDPVVRNASSPQSFNGYAYVENNPLSGVDPSGAVVTCGTGCTYYGLHAVDGDGNEYFGNEVASKASETIDAGGFVSHGGTIIGAGAMSSVLLSLSSMMFGKTPPLSADLELRMQALATGAADAVSDLSQLVESIQAGNEGGRGQVVDPQTNMTPDQFARHMAAHSLLFRMAQVRDIVAGLERSESVAGLGKNGGPIARAVFAVLGASMAAHYTKILIDNIGHQNDLRPRFGLPLINYAEGLELGGFPNGDMSRLNREKAIVRRLGGVKEEY